MKRDWLAIINYIGVGWLFNYLGLRDEGFVILGFFLFFDTVTGVIKTIALGKKPTSRRFMLGIISKALMLCVPLLLALLSKVTFERDLSSLVSILIGLLSVGEVYSIIQNIIIIKTQKEIEEYDAITAVLKLLLGVLRNFIDKGLPKT